jgi:hypothetical protein
MGVRLDLDVARRVVRELHLLSDFDPHLLLADAGRRDVDGRRLRRAGWPGGRAAAAGATAAAACCCQQRYAGKNTPSVHVNPPLACARPWPHVHHDVRGCGASMVPAHHTDERSR